MSTSLGRALRAAMDSSAAGSAVRRVAAGSIACAQAAAVHRRLRRIRERVIVGLGGEWSVQREMRSTEQLLTLAAGSRLIAILSLAVNAPFAAWRDSGLRRVLTPVLSLDLPERVRLVGWMIVVSVLTHTAVLGVLGARVEVVGWSVRAALAAGGLAVMWRPRPLALAWKDRAAKRGPHSAGL